MSVQPRRFTRTAPSKTDKTRAVDIRMTDMLAGDAAWWDARRFFVADEIRAESMAALLDPRR